MKFMALKRRSSSINTMRLDHLHQDPYESHLRFILYYGDLSTWRLPNYEKFQARSMLGFAIHFWKLPVFTLCGSLAE